MNQSNRTITKISKLEATLRRQDDIDSEENPKKDGRGLLTTHQAQAKWEELYPFVFYSASSQGWFCKICQQYG